MKTYKKTYIFKFNKEKLDFEKTNILVKYRTVVFILLYMINEVAIFDNIANLCS